MERERFSFRGGVVCFVFIISLGPFGVVRGVDDPNEFNAAQGVSTISSGTLNAGSCPAWSEVLNREGSDGGQLTIEVDACRVYSVSVISMPQTGGAGSTANLEPGDIIIVWDEDPGHGSSYAHRNFTFTGSYVADPGVADPNTGYIRLTTTVEQTNWAIYRVLSSGLFTKGDDKTNEHELLDLTPVFAGFVKDDDVPDGDCRSPGDELTYTICWDNMDGWLLEEAWIIDYLPEGVSYPPGVWSYELGDPNDPNEPPFYLIPPDPGYDPETHSYVWPLGDIDPNTSGCVSLTVVVNEGAEPGHYLHNVAELWGVVYDPNGIPRTMRVAYAEKDTLVCCWDTDGILYVDQSATGGNSGVNWPNAYTDLQDALARARETVCAEAYLIYVAQGPYYPGDDTSDTFDIPDGVAVYGGFPKGGSDFWQRDPRRYQTILTGTVKGSP